MRDLVVRQALETMAREAAGLLRELVAGGDEIPYDVRGSDGGELARYEPLTARYVRDHADELHSLESFGIACATLESSSMAEPYLAEMGIAAPADSRRRGELAGIVFLCRLWADSTDFSLDHDRLTSALDEVEAAASPTGEEIDVVVPLRGLVMSAARLDLPMASIVRADTVDAPADAAAIEGMGASPWEPVFLAVARVSPYEDGEGPVDVGARAVESLRGLVTTLRLFAPGDVALGPHAWIRAAGDRWRRISTGAGRPRRGGYRLADDELSSLRGFARAVVGRERAPFSSAKPINRAISRFEAGLERPVAVEGLSDHLLALRFVLEGGGPAGLGLSQRVAALCAEPEGRDEVRAIVDRAAAIERELWSGEPAGSGSAPLDTAFELEELCRAILKDAVCGHLGNDLRATADEILLADGLTAGEGSLESRGETAEWQLGDDGAEDAHRELLSELDDAPESEAGWPSEEELEAARRLERLRELGSEAEAIDPLPTEESPIEPPRAEAAPEAEPGAISPAVPEPGAPTISELETQAYRIVWDREDDDGLDVSSAFDFPAEDGPRAVTDDAEEEEGPGIEQDHVGRDGVFDADAEIEAEAGTAPDAQAAPIDLFRASRERLLVNEHLQEIRDEPEPAGEEESRLDPEPEPDRSPARSAEDALAAWPLPASAVEQDEGEHAFVQPDHVSALDEPSIEPALHDGSSPVYELIERTKAERRERNERVAQLFPRPEECEWNVRELGYQRRSSLS